MRGHLCSTTFANMRDKYQLVEELRTYKISRDCGESINIHYLLSEIVVVFTHEALEEEESL
jgi:hypothetical protein